MSLTEVGNSRSDVNLLHDHITTLNDGAEFGQLAKVDRRGVNLLQRISRNLKGGSDFLHQGQ